MIRQITRRCLDAILLLVLWLVGVEAGLRVLYGPVTLTDVEWWVYFGRAYDLGRLPASFFANLVGALVLAILVRWLLAVFARRRTWRSVWRWMVRALGLTRVVASIAGFYAGSYRVAARKAMVGIQPRGRPGQTGQHKEATTPSQQGATGVPAQIPRASEAGAASAGRDQIAHPSSVSILGSQGRDQIAHPGSVSILGSQGRDQIAHPGSVSILGSQGRDQIAHPGSVSILGSQRRDQIAHLASVSILGSQGRDQQVPGDGAVVNTRTVYPDWQTAIALYEQVIADDALGTLEPCDEDGVLQEAIGRLMAVESSRELGRLWRKGPDGVIAQLRGQLARNAQFDEHDALVWAANPLSLEGDGGKAAPFVTLVGSGRSLNATRDFMALASFWHALAAMTQALGMLRDRRPESVVHAVLAQASALPPDYLAFAWRVAGDVRLAAEVAGAAHAATGLIRLNDLSVHATRLRDLALLRVEVKQDAEPVEQERRVMPNLDAMFKRATPNF